MQLHKSDFLPIFLIVREHSEGIDAIVVHRGRVIPVSKPAPQGQIGRFFNMKTNSNTVTGLFISTNNDKGASKFSFENTPGAVETLQKAINTQEIGVLGTGDGESLIVIDAEARITGKPLNTKATLMMAQPIFGNVVWIGYTQNETEGLTFTNLSAAYDYMVGR